MHRLPITYVIDIEHHLRKFQIAATDYVCLKSREFSLEISRNYKVVTLQKIFFCIIKYLRHFFIKDVKTWDCKINAIHRFQGYVSQKISFLVFQKIMKNHKKCLFLTTTEKWAYDEKMPATVILDHNKHKIIPFFKKMFQIFFWKFLKICLL